MNKLHRIFLYFFLSLVLWGGPADVGEENGSVQVGNGLNLTEREAAYLKNHPVLRVHNESNWPPFNFNENGVPRGFSVDYIKLLAGKLGIDLEFVSGYTWEEFMKMLPTDRLDLIINIAPTQERKKTIVFTTPYTSVRNAIYTNINNQIYYSLEDLRGKRVALPKDFFIQRFLAKNYPEIRQVLVADQLEALQLLSFGKVDAVIGKQVVVDYLLREHLLSNIIATSYLKEPGTLSSIALGAARSDAILIGILEKVRRHVTPKEMERLKHKWFGINALLDTKSLLNAEEREELKRKKVLKVCIKPDYAPIEFFQGRSPQGIAIDTVSILAHRLGMDLEYVESRSWEQTENLLREHRCDILPAALQTRSNRALLLFSRPYLGFESVVITRESLGEITGLERLKGKTMASRWDNPLAERLRQSHPWLRVKEFESYEEVFDAIEKGRADFTVVARPIFEYYRAYGGLNRLHIAGEIPVRTDVSLAVRKDELILFNLLNKVLEALPRETFHAIREKWTGQTVIRKIDYGLMFRYLAAAGGVILIILLAYIRQKHLSRKIEELNSTLEERIEEALEKNRQQQILMLQRDRLANMGEMIAMIAHQWRQPLNNLSLLNQLLVAKYRKKKLDDGMMDYFETNSRKQIEQMSQTIDDFRNFYKPEKEKRLFGVEKTVRQLIDLVGMSFAAEQIEIECRCEGDNTFLGYPNELSHAILNILNNAKEALIEKRALERRIRIDIYRDAAEIVIRICDNAGGIPEEILPKIFDPYFSTKSEKNGTGLGLYMVNVIVTEHLASRVSVENREEGACFTIVLSGETKVPVPELPDSGA